MTDKYLGIVMEYASGGNLFDHVSKGCELRHAPLLRLQGLAPLAANARARAGRATEHTRLASSAQEGAEREGRALVL